MIDSKILLNIPFDFDTLCKVYPPTVKDVVSKKEVLVYRELLCKSQEEIEDDFSNDELATIELPDMNEEQENNEEKFLTPLEFLLSSAYHNEEVHKLVLNAFKFFTQEDVTLFFQEKKILFGKGEEILKKLEAAEDINKIPAITEENFFEFQNLIRQAMGLSIVEPPREDEPYRVKVMKARARYRDKIKNKTDNGLSLHTIITSIICMGLGLTPLNIGEISYVSLFKILERYQKKERYGLDIRSLIAGASSKKVNPKYWIDEKEGGK